MVYFGATRKVLKVQFKSVPRASLICSTSLLGEKTPWTTLQLGEALSKPDAAISVPPNKHMRRAGTHKVLGRGQPCIVLGSAPRARVLTGHRAGADVNR
jgi:hypothetical protein